MHRLTVATAILFVLNGCVIREFTIKSEPSGAEVYIDGRRVGKTPLRRSFEHYGTRRIVLYMPQKAGYLAYVGRIHLKIPWWQCFPLDFITDVLVPFKITDRKEFFFKLKKIEEIPEDLSERAEKFKERAEGGGR